MWQPNCPNLSHNTFESCSYLQNKPCCTVETGWRWSSASRATSASSSNNPSLRSRFKVWIKITLHFMYHTLHTQLMIKSFLLPRHFSKVPRCGCWPTQLGELIQSIEAKRHSQLCETFCSTHVDLLRSSEDAGISLSSSEDAMRCMLSTYTNSSRLQDTGAESFLLCYLFRVCAEKWPV